MCVSQMMTLPALTSPGQIWFVGYQALPGGGGHNLMVNGRAEELAHTTSYGYRNFILHWSI